MDLLSGNQAIARGAWEAGARIGVAYPGTPSTETMETFGAFPDVYAEWAPNEKVAVEVGLGASVVGARVLASMKHVGVNVAADPIFTSAYTGVSGGYVILAADDPGMHSSQNEQDSRFYARAAHIPLFEPSDSQEALDFTRDAFDLSEQFDLPVFIRSTVRISHSKTPVEVGERKDVKLKPYEKNAAKYVMMPAFAKPRRKSLDARCAVVREWAETAACNKIIAGDSDLGIVCSGAAYQYVRDALPEASVLKLGMTWPLPEQKLKEFAGSVHALYVIDEASDFLSTHVRAMGIEVSSTPNPLPRDGELTPGIIAEAFGETQAEHAATQNDLPGRPPALCAGCPHRLVFKELTRARCIITGDIGCYTLGALPPLSGMDTCVDMGASVSMSHGMELALHGTDHKPIAAVIGDSTFGHSGLSSLLGTVYNQGAGIICILDNRTTAMTGHQGDMFNGITLQGRVSRELSIEGIVSALGVQDVAVVNPNNMQDTRAAIKSAIENADELSVIVFRSPCVLLRDSFKAQKPLYVSGKCTGCGVCATLGCPAISRDPESGFASIDADMCVGCGQCKQYCRFDAIEDLEGGR